MSNQNEPPHPNQWYTPAFVRVYRIEDCERIGEEHFSDLQMAYLWVKACVGDQLQAPNFLRSFEQVIERLAVAHEDDERGYIFAQKNGFEYCVFYRTTNLDDRSRFSVQ